ncbi:hypothetical protein PG991_013241 [Apiospora marii]|uniref:Rhodopsin domain-containing protein n=1 Tax=Apiospora marii TaxID=335849 RepID=A0ABR1R7A2_9PEZI
MDAGTMPKGMSTTVFLGVGIMMIALAAAFCIARVIGNLRKIRKLYLADYISILSVLLFAGMFVVFNLTVNGISVPWDYRTVASAYTSLALDNPMTASLRYLAQLGVASALVSGYATWTAKAPIFFLYVQLFGIQKWIRVISHLALVGTFLFILGITSWISAVCSPVGREISPEFIQTCTVTSSIGGLATGAVGLAVDILIFVLPLPIIAKLRLPLAKKIGVSLCFLSGIFAVAASTTALYFRVTSLSVSTTDMKTASMGVLVELTIAIMVGCVPAVHAFWTVVVANSIVYSRVASAFSQLSTLKLRRSKNSHTSSNSYAATDNGVYGKAETNIQMKYGPASEEHTSERRLVPPAAGDDEVPFQGHRQKGDTGLV